MYRSNYSTNFHRNVSPPLAATSSGNFYRANISSVLFHAKGIRSLVNHAISFHVTCGKHVPWEIIRFKIILIGEISFSRLIVAVCRQRGAPSQGPGDPQHLRAHDISSFYGNGTINRIWHDRFQWSIKSIRVKLATVIAPVPYIPANLDVRPRLYTWYVLVQDNDPAYWQGSAYDTCQPRPGHHFTRPEYPLHFARLACIVVYTVL